MSNSKVIESMEREPFGRVMKHDEPMHCMIEIDGVFYPAIMQRHNLVTVKLSADQKKLIDSMDIREYTLDEQFHALKVEPFEVTCNDGHKSMCYMADNRRSVIELNFSKLMNLPEDGFDGQAEIRVLPDESRWAACPYCGKKAVKILLETRIHMMPYKCKNSKCQRDFIVNV
ncbi:hypothetical protein [Clostridium sp. E02]|uniref:hypothetical protein n=1 Tax=Clostridium sp. E02 TaxID=2487134 RepID=UPI001FA949C5|nr:hypothetical protein [Clostridium sp. E02]